MEKRLFQQHGKYGALYHPAQTAVLAACLMISTVFSMAGCEHAHGSPPVSAPDPVDITDPVDSPDPAKPGTPAEPDNPADPGKPAKPDDPAKPDNPAEPSKPAEPGTPAKPDSPAQPDHPAGGPVYDGSSSMVIVWPNAESELFPELGTGIVLSRSGAGGLSRELTLHIGIDASAQAAVDGKPLSPEGNSFIIRAADYQGSKHLITVIKTLGMVPHSRDAALVIID